MIESLVSNKKDKVEDDNNREIQLIREQMELREKEIEDIKRQEKQDAEEKSAEKQQKIQTQVEEELKGEDLKPFD